MHQIPPPNPRDLLPPVLACLPAAFVSPRPPPALLPLLSPILRQRVHLLTSTSVGRSNQSNWLNYLTYSPTRAAKLVEVVENMQLEPHPVSGEIELFSDEEPVIKYRRLDQETLRARCEVKEHQVAVVWVWCEGDGGGTGLEALEGAFGGGGGQAAQPEPTNGWKVAEVLPLEDMEDNDERSDWYTSMTQANETKVRRRSSTPVVERRASPQTNGAASTSEGHAASDDDDDYWASYDRTPGRTPARTPSKRRSPAPTNRAPHALSQQQSAEDTDYYARYGAEVQPAMDAHDPDESSEGLDSTLPGTELSPPPRASRQHRDGADDDHTLHQSAVANAEYASFLSENRDHTPPQTRPQQLTMPERPSGPMTAIPIPATKPSSRPSVEKLEQAAASSGVEHGIRAHISTEIKSLYRLARGVGIERGEFEAAVKTELELLGLLDE